MTKIRKTLLFLILITIIISATAIYVNKASANTADNITQIEKAKIEKTIRLSIDLEQKGFVVHQKNTSNNLFTLDEKNNVKKEILEKCKNVFSNKKQLLSKRLGQLSGIVDMQNDKFIVLDGGARWVKINDITINGDNATVIAEVRFWSKFIEDGKVYTPENTMKLTYILNKEGDLWKIVEYDGDFLPDDEP
ncbi:hypothetical protein [Caldanaerobius polysaccharolyticus]|uniref:hypothetical protein n=1 Tax=Caldanaerobius polysaccharolyticus TaxID=44256 RepID=UPI000479C7B0|nr:hypothetical protein [Caldanaerobius polysaccharolyticus]